VTCSCEYGIEPSDFMKGREYRVGHKSLDTSNLPVHAFLSSDLWPTLYIDQLIVLVALRQELLILWHRFPLRAVAYHFF
jgi:hypothetical protein